MIRPGARVGTIDGPPGTVRYRGRNNDENEVVDVELDGHTYGPGRPLHRYPIGMVWPLAPVEPEPITEPVPLPDSGASAPLWYPTADDTTAADDAEWWADYTDPGRRSLPTDAVLRARKVRRARTTDQD